MKGNKIEIFKVHHFFCRSVYICILFKFFILMNTYIIFYKIQIFYQNKIKKMGLQQKKIIDSCLVATIDFIQLLRQFVTDKKIIFVC